jgi:hypothetical protein
MTVADAGCNPYHNAISYSISPSSGTVNGSAGDNAGFSCYTASVGADHSFNVLCTSDLYTGTQIGNYAVTWTGPAGNWGLSYCSAPGRCAVNNTSTPNGYVNQAGVQGQWQGAVALPATQSTQTYTMSAKYRFIATPIVVTMTTYKDWSRP